jgi:hypothetical protein
MIRNISISKKITKEHTLITILIFSLAIGQLIPRAGVLGLIL